MQFSTNEDVFNIVSHEKIDIKFTTYINLCR